MMEETRCVFCDYLIESGLETNSHWSVTRWHNDESIGQIAVCVKCWDKYVKLFIGNFQGKSFDEFPKWEKVK